MKKEGKKLIFIGFSILCTLVFLVCFGILSYHLLKINIIPIKYLIASGVVLFLIFLIFLLGLFKNKNYIIKVIVMIFMVLFSIGFSYGTKYIKNTYNFFDNSINSKDGVLSYSVLVLNESNYQEMEDLNNKTIMYVDNIYKEDIKKELEKKIQYIESLHFVFGTMADMLLNKEVDAIVLENSEINVLEDEIETFEEMVHVIYTFEIPVKENEEEEREESNVDLTLDSFILYISGIDKWGSVGSARGRSDVNQIVVVNPKTNHILLLNTPRDYYVQLAGTGGVRDKLTHAGIYGINRSIKTMENLYNIQIDYYLRVNFNSLIQVVDVIGGIDINSDKAFRAKTNKNVYVEEGWNHFDGRQALAYARERYAYTNGDHHRGANQQQVITAIINKVTNSRVLISKYNSLLEALNGSFQTDVPMEKITSFIKYQLDKMPSWKIESIAVTGTGDMQPTYSMGSKLKLYVMKPNMDSVNKAKQKINEVFNEA